MSTIDTDASLLIDAYLKRPDYSGPALDGMLGLAQIETGAAVCDVGAGIGNLTIPLLERGLAVAAVEPNPALLALGQKRTRAWQTKWYDGTGEATGLASGQFSLVVFGSSFHVCDRVAALREAARILAPGGWFACMWNHRDLEDALQRRVENVIASMIPDYDIGSRREDQRTVIRETGLFGDVHKIESPLHHRMSASDWIDAWRLHGTLARQAGGVHPALVAAIAECLGDRTSIEVPYVTRIWMARRGK